MRSIRHKRSARFPMPIYCREPNVDRARAARDPMAMLLEGCTLTIEADADAFDPYNRSGNLRR